MNSRSAYNSSDPAILFAYKQQEAIALLNIVQSISPNVNRHELVRKVVDTIAEHADVKKLILLLNKEYEIELAWSIGFSQLPVIDNPLLVQTTTTTRVTEEGFPALHAAGIEYIVPIGDVKNGAPLGWFLIADFADSEEETENDLVFVQTIGNILAIALENRRLFRKQIQQQALNHELEFAARIQKQSLPNKFELFPELEIYGVNLTHHQVGGDFFDLIPLPGNRLFVVQADVAGKGFGAALLVASLQATIRTLVEVGASFCQMIDQIGNTVKRLTFGEHFVTLFMAFIDLNTQTIEYINAGHPAPYLRQASGSVLELSEGCIPLGIIPIADFTQGRQAFRPGDNLFVFTDGAFEQTNPAQDELGLPALKQFIVNQTTGSVRTVVFQILDFVWAHAEKEELNDDLTLLCIRYLHKK
jgi:sigma-B regulation protein RsbU (phosphoserine phosphatase)